MIEMIVAGIMDLLGVAVKKVFPDKSPDEINVILSDVKPEVEGMVNASVMKAQAAVSAKEASSVFKFVAYARASLVWICVAAVVYSQVVVPCIYYLFPHAHLPAIQTAMMISLLYSLLGVSAAHHVMQRTQ